MLSYREIKENELIREDILEHIPAKCEECGGDLSFTDNLTFLCCTNPQCPTKVGARIESMCKFLQIDGFGEAASVTIARRFRLAGPAQLAVVVNKIDDIPGVAGWATKRENARQGFAKELSLWEYVKALNLPKISNKARDLLDGYESLEAFYEDLEEQQVPLVAARLGIKSSLDSGVLAVDTFNTLMQYKGEILGCRQFFNIKKEDKNAITVNVCITEKVPGYANKPAFIARLRELAGSTLNIVQVDSVTAKTHILVGDISANTSKMKKARAMNEKAGKTMVFIGNSKETEDFVLDLVKRAKG